MLQSCVIQSHSDPVGADNVGDSSRVSHSLAGKVAIVTGASRGLGLYCAIAFARHGAKVVVLGRSARESPLHLPGTVFQTARLIKECTGASALPIVCDITDNDDTSKMVERVVKTWGCIDVLLNNAAYMLAEGESLSEMADCVFEQIVNVNFLGTMRVTRAVLPVMQNQRSGNIINVSGRSSTRGSPLEATKAAIETLTLGLADTLRPLGIAVNSIRPSGFIDTPGMLLNPGVKPEQMSSISPYLEATTLLATQTADTYTGQIKTDREVICDLENRTTLQHNCGASFGTRSEIQINRI